MNISAVKTCAKLWTPSAISNSKEMRSVLKSRGYSTESAPSEVTVTIDGRAVTVPQGTSILDACKKIRNYIPTLCYHPLLSVVGQCRVCLVEAKTKDRTKLVPACATPVENGMAIETDTEVVNKSVMNSLRFLRCRHPNQCMTCESNGRCEFQKLAYRYNAEELLPEYFHHERSHAILDKSSNGLVRDMSKCVLCSRCIRACSEIQGMNIYGLVSRGGDEYVSTINDLPLNQTNCVTCGQCTAVCPVGALVEKPHIHAVQHGLKHKKNKVYVVHTAPAVRVAISEEFGLEAGSISTGKLVAALRQLGFDYVFDTNFSADVTIVEEATEFVKRLTTGGVLPMFTSCCPAWINLVEKTYPQLEPHLSTCKSPNAMIGSLIKTYFANKINVSPEDIVTVSIMPCVAKKDEIARPQLKVAFTDKNGEKKFLPETDYVLTTRELGRLIQEERIPFPSLKDEDFDAPLGITTGAAALFGATGGVLEAALRTAAEYATGKPLEKVDFQAVRGFEYIREATVKVGDASLNVAVVHGTKRVRKVVEDVLAGTSKYHLIEVMACPGGCIGGGGEPKTAALDPDILKKRVKAIYEIDKNKPLRKSHENPAVKALYSDFIKGEPNSHKAHKLLHTYYTDRTAEVKGRSDVPFGKPLQRASPEEEYLH